MIIKGIIDEDFVNYKKPSMTIEFPYCSFKCDKESGMQVCQNSALASAPDIDIEIDEIVFRYISNPISESIVFQGLEPFDSIDIVDLIDRLRQYTNDDIVIYTGYTEDELNQVKSFHDILSMDNIIIKFGRYIHGQKPHYDEVLGINLASDNQYAKRYN